MREDETGVHIFVYKKINLSPFFRFFSSMSVGSPKKIKSGKLTWPRVLLNWQIKLALGVAN